MNLGTAMAGAGKNRVENDFYPTPAEVTEALLNVWTPAFTYGPPLIWEPACGDGAIARVMEAKGYQVFKSDIVEHDSYPLHRVENFLETGNAIGDCLITNPPFALAEQFIRHARKIGVTRMALLLKSTYFHAAKRARLFREWQPAHIYALTWRPDFLGKGAPTMECAWFIWEGNATETTYNVLPRPSGELFRPR